MTVGSGPLSPRSVRVTAARRLSKRGFREADRAFLAEGPQAVREALALTSVRGGAVSEIFVAPDAEQRHADLVQAAQQAGVPVHRLPAEALASLSGTVTPQGVVAVCPFLDVSLDVALAGSPTLVVVLVQVRDPGNAGTVLRAADAAGAGAVVFTEASVDPYNGKCVRASAGSLFHLPVVTGAPVDAAMAGLRAAGLRVLAADGAGERDLDDALDSGSLAAPTAWLFGNEAWGLPAQVAALADEVVRVPIHGRAESLNLATAAAVCLYASARAQRRGRTRADG
ncbi:MAG TPA: RNA methyltransferase [Actinomycetes bacterium]